MQSPGDEFPFLDPGLVLFFPRLGQSSGQISIQQDIQGILGDWVKGSLGSEGNDGFDQVIAGHNGESARFQADHKIIDISRTILKSLDLGGFNPHPGSQGGWIQSEPTRHAALGLNVGGRPGPGGQRPQQQYQKIDGEMLEL